MFLRALLAVVGRLFCFSQFRHFKAHLLFDDFGKCDVRRSHVGGVGDQWTAGRAAARIELAHTTGDEVYQNVGVANFLQCFFAEFSVQVFFCPG
jgi:hypothetical protein